MEYVLEVRGLVHRYGEHTALAGVDLTVKSGECVALLGPNGAGKTTLVRNVIGLIEGRADRIEVAGGHPRKAETRRKLGVVQQAVGFPRSLTVGEIVGGAASPDRSYGFHDRSNRRGDGGPDRRLGGSSHDLRHGESCRTRGHHRRGSARLQDGWPVGRMVEGR